VAIEMTARVTASRPVLGNKGIIPGVKNVVAVSSGKGGVGKSTVAVNLACALRQTGARVGILDADVYGPNVPMMLGVSGQPAVVDKKIVPFERHGLQVMSMALLVADDQPVIWRGPMLHSAVRQFLFDVAWHDLDYLVVDLPPGTGDAQLSLSQQAHLMGAVIVTTPQDVSVLDVKKAIRMFQTVNVPILYKEAIDALSAGASAVSREHMIYDSPGFVTIAGGKLTTFRRMAAEVVDRAIVQLNVSTKSNTATRPLPGAVGLVDEDSVTKLAQSLANPALPEGGADYLAGEYGVRAPQLMARGTSDASAFERLDPELPSIFAQVDEALDVEMACTLDDVLSRRIPLVLRARDQGLGIAEKVAQRMAKRLGWDSARIERELAGYRAVVASSRTFRAS
jgi:MinD-like ATPase involved in chromosome partitioning or flagellar assembly